MQRIASMVLGVALAIFVTACGGSSSQNGNDNQNSNNQNSNNQNGNDNQQACGDGVVDGVEECDDDDQASGDGCDDQCQLEPGWECVGEPSVCSEICGNGEVDTGEDCDGPEFDGQTCIGLGYVSGELGCTDSCLFDYGDCHDCTIGCLAGFWDLDDDSQTGLCGCEYACQLLSGADAIDASFIDDNCDGSDGVVADCVFVSVSVGAATGLGTPEDPVDTITNGILTAQAQSLPAVCVSGETYNEQITMVSGISVYGGFDHTDSVIPFRRAPGVVTTVTAEGTVFFAPQIDVETHIEGLTIIAQTPTAPGESTYGVRLAGGAGELVIRYNVITAGAGQHGDDGVDIAPFANAAPVGSNGENGCSGGGCNGGSGGGAPTCPSSSDTYAGQGGDGGYDATNGVNGMSGSAQAPVGAGGDDAVCFSSAGSGGAGCPAATGCPAPSDGGPGTAGDSGLSIGQILGGLYVPAAGGAGQDGGHGKGGSGGGGGGGGGDGGGFCTADKGGGGGSGGCGGLGGGGGGGAQGGGGSFAVLVVAGTVTVTHNDLTTDGGGDGGAGGLGTSGQTGGLGGSGGDEADDAGAGGPGGHGSDGGLGGNGGGGGGGPSACLAHTATAVYSFTVNTTCVVGGAGQGGAGDNPGLSGVNGPTLQVD